MSVSGIKVAKNQRRHKVIPQNNLNWSHIKKVLGRIPAQAHNVLTHLHLILLTINVEDLKKLIKSVELLCAVRKCADRGRSRPTGEIPRGNQLCRTPALLLLSAIN